MVDKMFWIKPLRLKITFSKICFKLLIECDAHQGDKMVYLDFEVAVLSVVVSIYMVALGSVFSTFKKNVGPTSNITHKDHFGTSNSYQPKDHFGTEGV